MMHSLKILPEYFEAIRSDVKTFEIRKNDRDFRVGELLHLQEYNASTGMYTGREIVRLITYITDYAQQDGYVVMAIK